MRSKYHVRWVRGGRVLNAAFMIYYQRNKYLNISLCDMKEKIRWPEIILVWQFSDGI